MHHRIGAALNAYSGRLLINGAAQGLDSRGLTQRQIERVNMPAAHVQQAALILVTGNHLTDPALIQQLQRRVAIAFPELLLGLQMAHLLSGDGSEYTAVFQITLDLILGHTLTNDLAAFKGHLPQQLSLLGADSAFDHIDIAAITVNDLPAVAARSAEPHLRGFQNSDLETGLQQEQRTRQPGIAGADNAHVRFHLALQGGALGCGISGSCIVGLGVWSVRHSAASVLYFLRVRPMLPELKTARQPPEGECFRVKNKKFDYS